MEITYKYTKFCSRNLELHFYTTQSSHLFLKGIWKFFHGSSDEILLNLILRQKFSRLWPFLIRRKPSANSSSFFFLVVHVMTFIFCLFFAFCFEFLEVYSISAFLNLTELFSTWLLFSQLDSALLNLTQLCSTWLSFAQLESALLKLALLW